MSDLAGWNQSRRGIWFRDHDGVTVSVFQLTSRRYRSKARRWAWFAGKTKGRYASATFEEAAEEAVRAADKEKGRIK